MRDRNGPGAGGYAAAGPDVDRGEANCFPPAALHGVYYSVLSIVISEAIEPGHSTSEETGV